MGLTSVHDLDLVNVGGHSDSSRTAYTVQQITHAKITTKIPAFSIDSDLFAKFRDEHESMSDEKLSVLYVDLLI